MTEANNEMHQESENREMTEGIEVPPTSGGPVRNGLIIIGIIILAGLMIAAYLIWFRGGSILKPD